MKRLMMSVLIVAATASFCTAKDKNEIRVQLQMFKFRHNLPGKTYVDEPIWTTDNTPDKWENKVRVFNRGYFEVGKDKLEFKDGRCFWNKKEVPISGTTKVKMPENRIRQIYSPEIVMAEHGKGAFRIRPTQPIQYFEKRADGLFELKEVKLETGLDIEITGVNEEEDKGYIKLEDILITIRSVNKRKKIAGVNLPVGRPVLGKEKYDFYFRVRPGKDYGILVRAEQGRGGLLIRMRASSTHSGTFEGKPKKK